MIASLSPPTKWWKPEWPENKARETNLPFLFGGVLSI